MDRKICYSDTPSIPQVLPLYSTSIEVTTSSIDVDALESVPVDWLSNIHVPSMTGHSKSLHHFRKCTL